MVRISRSDVLKLARLARLELDEQELEQFTKEIDQILQYVQQIQTADSGELKPTSQVSGLTNVMRKDEITNYGYKPQDLLKNVPELEGELIRVRRIL